MKNDCNDTLQQIGRGNIRLGFLQRLNLVITLIDTLSIRESSSFPFLTKLWFKVTAMTKYNIKLPSSPRLSHASFVHGIGYCILLVALSKISTHARLLSPSTTTYKLLIPYLYRIEPQP